MSWRKTAWTILFSPVLLGLLVFAGILMVCKLPAMCCSRWRRVRYLPRAGILYYGTLVPLFLAVCGLAWWEASILAAIVGIAGDWLLPDPFTFVFDPRKRRAVSRAIEYFEADDEVLYGMVCVVGYELGRTVVSVPIKSGAIPPARRFAAVSFDGAGVEELDFEYVSAMHGIRPWF